MVTALRGKDMEFDGKVSIVTGGASGIGQAIAADLSENRATVAIADQMEDWQGAKKIAEVVPYELQESPVDKVAVARYPDSVTRRMKGL